MANDLAGVHYRRDAPRSCRQASGQADQGVPWVRVDPFEAAACLTEVHLASSDAEAVEGLGADEVAPSLVDWTAFAL